MKKIIFTMIVISMVMGLVVCPVQAEEIKTYFDTAPKTIPANLIISGSAIDGQNTSHIIRNNTAISGAEMYTVSDISESELNNIWYVFGGSGISTTLNGGKYLNLNNFEAGTTYVYQAKVKNTSADSNVVPYYGIANTDNRHGYSYAVGSNCYGKNGMAVTSNEWMNFRDTITFSENWDETANGYLGQVLIQGIETKNGTKGASLAVMKNAVNADVLDSLEDDSLYLAEEIAYDINIYPEEDLDFEEELKLKKNGSLTLNAQVVNQLEITGTLDQKIEWVVVTADRKNVIENITSTVEGNKITLSCDETLADGRYAAVAISEKYEIVKGIEFSVKKDLSGIYREFEGVSGTGNLIQNPSNGGFATASSESIGILSGDGYVTIEALNDIKSELGVEGLRVRNIGNNGFPSTFNFEAGKTYYIKARVRNPQPEIDTYFNASISNSTKDTLSLTTEYGTEGMLLTGDWQEFVASIRVSDNYDNGVAIKNRNFTIGLSSGCDEGAKADVELSVYVEEEKPIKFTNEILSGDNILTENKNITLKAELKNQLGVAGSLTDDFKWVALTSDRVSLAEGFEFTGNDNGTVTMWVKENTPAGNFVIAAYSEKYDAVAGVDVKVMHEKYNVYVATDGDDEASGSYREPLGTLPGAKAFVRKKIAEGVFDFYGGIDVIFMPGEYEVKNVANFEKADSGTKTNPVTYKADGKVIFKGSMDLELEKAEKVTDESVLKRLQENVREKVIELDVSEYPHDLTKIELISSNKTVIKGGGEYPEIYLNGNEQNLAQWPNGDGEFAKYEYVAGDKFSFKEDAPLRWVDAEGWWIGGYPNRDYDYKRIPGGTIDVENKVITVESSEFTKADNKSKRWKAYNLLEELDEVGEWYIDAETKKLYYYPPELKGDERLEITYLTNNMINMNQAEYISFEGFEFAKSRADAFNTSDIRNIRLTGCKFRDLGGSAFYNIGSKYAKTDKDYWQRQHINGAYDCIIENCVFENIGAYGVYISGGNVDTLIPGNNIIKNNFFYKCSQKVRGYPTIILAGCGNILEKNNISNLPFHAVNIMGNDHIIRYNEIYDVCRETEDCAAIYQGRNTVQRGTVVEYNYLHDLYPLYTFTEDRYINAAIYWDDSQTGMTVKNNIIRNAKLGIFNNGGIDNNYSANTIIDTYMAMQIDVRGAAQNINNTIDTGFAGYIENSEVYYEKYQNLKTIIETDPINSGETGKALGRFNVVKDNLFVDSEKEVIISEYCGVVENEEVLECEDFVNPEVQDYRIKLGSETHRKNSNLLNENFDIELIGADEKNFNLKKDFELYYPKGRISDSGKLRFTWSEATGATYYLLEISKNSDFKDLIYSDKVSLNYADVSGLDSSLEKYYWRVVAINSSRNMADEWVSKIGEFYLGGISVDNVLILEDESGRRVSAEIKNELNELIPNAQIYVASYSEAGELIGVHKSDISFESTCYEFSKAIEKNEEVSYIRLFLWDGMTPLNENTGKKYIKKAEF